MPARQAGRRPARHGATQFHRRRQSHHAEPGRVHLPLQRPDAAHQIIVAQRLATNPADFAGLIPLVDQARDHLGRKLREVSGGTGCATEANLEAMAERRIRAYLSPGRIRHGETDPTVGRVLKRKPGMQAMADTIRSAAHRLDTGCASRSWSQCSDTSNGPEAFDSSSSGASKRSEENGQ